MSFKASRGVQCYQGLPCSLQTQNSDHWRVQTHVGDQSRLALRASCSYIQPCVKVCRGSCIISSLRRRKSQPPMLVDPSYKKPGSVSNWSCYRGCVDWGLQRKPVPYGSSHPFRRSMQYAMNLDPIGSIAVSFQWNLKCYTCIYIVHTSNWVGLECSKLKDHQAIKSTPLEVDTIST